MSFFYFLVLVLLAEDTSQALPEAEFVEQPASQNVSLGSSVVFNCTGYSLGYHWLINDEQFEIAKQKISGLDKEDVVVNDVTDLKIHLLTVPATLMNNGTTVKCYIYSQMTIASDTAVLQVQGLLDAVTDIKVEWKNSTTFKVTFNPPYTLDGVPIRNYSIELFSLVPMHTQIQSVCSTVEVEPMTTIDICNVYNISVKDTLTMNVTAWNDAGEGETLTTELNGIVEACFPSSSVVQVQSLPLSDTTHHFTAAAGHSYYESSRYLVYTQAHSLYNNHYYTETNSVPTAADDVDVLSLVIGLCVSSAALLILLVAIVFLMTVVWKYRIKNRNLKFAEMDARFRQRNAEVVLNSFSVSSTGFTPAVKDQTMLMPMGVANPNLIEVLAEDKAVQLIDCPAYATLPVQTKGHKQIKATII